MALFVTRFDLRNPPMAGVSMAQRYASMLEMAEWADRLGGYMVILSEHHGSPDGYLPSPLPMAAAVASRTSRVRISITALVAPFHDPLRLAEDIAVVDLISGGRLDITIGAGYVRSEFDMFDVDLADRPRLVEETVATLRAAWTGEPFDFRGRQVRVTPTPFRRRGPRIVLGGSSPGAARRAARIGDGFLPSGGEFWPPYRAECLALGKPDPGDWLGGTTDVVTLAEDPEQAWAELGPYFLHEVNAYGAWQAQDDVATGYRAATDVDELRATGQYRIVTPGQYLDEVAGELPFTLLHPMVGGIPPELGWRTLRLFEEQVLPHLG